MIKDARDEVRVAQVETRVEGLIQCVGFLYVKCFLNLKYLRIKEKIAGKEINNLFGLIAIAETIISSNLFG